MRYDIDWKTRAEEALGLHTPGRFEGYTGGFDDRHHATMRVAWLSGLLAQAYAEGYATAKAEKKEPT